MNRPSDQSRPSESESPQAAWRRYLRFWGSDNSRDLDDELRFHFEASVDEFISMGMSPHAAGAEATTRMGDMSRFREQCARIDSQWDRRRTIADVAQGAVVEMRHAARQLRRTPSLTVAAVLCFALGIGANTSIFSVVDAVLFRPLPFHDADRLVLLGEALPGFGIANTHAISPPEYRDYQALSGRVFTNLAMFESGPFVLAGNGDPERVSGASVSAPLFDVLGVKAALGRTFRVGEDSLSAPDVVVLSDGLWRRRFGADPGIIGRSVTMDGRPVQVIGVMPRDFSFPLPGLGGGVAELFAPFKITADADRLRGQSYEASLLARLAPGVTQSQAQAAAVEVARRFPQRYPAVYGPTHTTLPQLTPLRDSAVGNVRNSLLVLLAAVGLVLLIACINVSSLLLARSAARQRELAVRRALGASRGRLLQQFFMESLLLVVLGGALGVVLSVSGTRVIAARAPQSLLQGYRIGIDARVLAFTAAVTIVTAFVVSLAPALQRREGGLATTLRDEGRTASGGIARQRGRRTLVISEIALALVVASGAALMVRSLIDARNADPGFDPGHLVTFRVALPDYRYASDASVHQAEQELTARLRAVPGIVGASGATGMPMENQWSITVALEGTDLPNPPLVLNTLVLPGYFDALRIHMLSGTAFNGHESDATEPVAIINESFAKKYYPGTNPIGRRLKWGAASSPAPWKTIVGVSADVREVSLDKPVGPAMYLPVFQNDTGLIVSRIRSLAYAVRVAGPPEAMFDAIRRTVREADPGVPIVNLRTENDIESLSVASRSFDTALLSAFAVLALVLAAIGIYGLLAFAVTQRTREIGIRLAIGGTPGHVRALVVRQGGALGAIGVAIGLLGAVGVTRVMRTQLYDVSPLDPVALVGAAAVLLLTVLLASYLPARRASRIDPQSAMRSD